MSWPPLLLAETREGHGDGHGDSDGSQDGGGEEPLGQLTDQLHPHAQEMII